MELIQENKNKYNIITSTEIEMAEKQLKSNENDDENEDQTKLTGDEIFKSYDVSPANQNENMENDEDDNDYYVPKNMSWNKPDPLPEENVLK